MLVKYYGLVVDEQSGRTTPRASFLSDGLFRMTQPKFLNDRGSEAKLFPYFNEFAPTDIAWARKQYDKTQLGGSYEPTKEYLENFFLKPLGVRYGDKFPYMVRQQTNFNSMDDYDKNHFVRSAELVNSFLVEALSCNLGVLSLCKSDTNELMWTHYSSNGKGLAIVFKESHPFFKQFLMREVSYSPEKRATMTYYKGSFRINGIPIKNFHVSDFSNPSAICTALLSNGVDIMELAERLICSKAEKWVSEDEVRIICPNAFCEYKSGKIIEPQIDLEIPEALRHFFQGYNEVWLKKIPFDAFESVVFGYETSDADKQTVIKKISDNPKLSHMKIKVAKHNVYGQIETQDLLI